MTCQVACMFALLPSQTRTEDTVSLGTVRSTTHLVPPSSVHTETPGRAGGSRGAGPPWRKTRRADLPMVPGRGVLITREPLEHPPQPVPQPLELVLAGVEPHLDRLNVVEVPGGGVVEQHVRPVAVQAKPLHAAVTRL